MTIDADLETRLRADLREGPEACPRGVVDRALDAVAAHPGRARGWSIVVERLAVRLAPPLAGLRLAAVLAVLLLLLLAAMLAALGGLVRPPAPDPLRMNELVAVAVAGDVWLIDPDSGSGHRLRTPDRDETAVAWSPDGTRLATLARDAAGMRVDLVRADGTGLTTVLGPVGWAGDSLAWSPDGTTLAVSAGPTASDSRIVLIDTDGRGSRTLEVRAASDPAVSPDGRSLAFVAGLPGEVAVHVADADGRSVRRLASFGVADGPLAGGPAWSADGRSLVVGLGGGPGPARLVVLAVDRGSVTSDTAMAFPPIAIVALDGGGVTVAAGTGLETMDLGTGRPPGAGWTPLPGVERIAGLARSPDGRRVAVLGVSSCGLAPCPVRLLLLARGAAAEDAREVWPSGAADLVPDEQATGLSWQPLARPDGPVAFSVEESCATVSDGTRVTGAAVETWTGLAYRCLDRASDPRLSGTRRILLDTETRPDGTATISGTAVLENDAGTWTGSFAGTVDADGAHHLGATASGSGAYDGLVLDFAITGTGLEFTLSGTMRPAP